MKVKIADFYLKQHRDSKTHVKNHAQRMVRQVQASIDAPANERTVRCEGVSLSDSSGNLLSQYMHHLKQWLAWQSSCPELRKHSYTYTDSSDSYIIRHGDCAETCVQTPGERPVCGNCKSLAAKDGLRRQIARQGLKKFAAELLQCKLFQSNEELQALETTIKLDVLYERHATQVQKLLNFDLPSLQAWVRSSFMSIRADRRNKMLSIFLATVVRPSLAVNVFTASAKKPQLLAAQSMFSKFLQNPNNESLDRMNVALAQSCLEGKLQHHPLVLGMLLNCIRTIDRNLSGLDVRGRNAEDSILGTDVALELARDAGVMLAMAGANQGLLEQFGYQKRNMKLNFENQLVEAGLPTPFLSLDNEEVLMDNLRLLDQKCSMLTGTTGCTLVALGCRLRDARC